jgi:hypothetical protein
MPDVNVLKVNVLPQDDDATDILVGSPFTPNTDPIVAGSTVQEALESLQGQISGGSGAVTSIGTIDSETKSANGAVISGSDLVMQTADATNPGLISTGIQTIAGVKTFSSAPNLSSLTASLPLQLDGSKNITSTAINLAGAQVTGVLPNANTTATSANTNSAIVARDGSGNFTAGTITATLTGTASLATNVSLGSANQILYQSGSNTTAKLAVNASATTMYLSQVSSGTPAWAQPSTSNISDYVQGSFTPTLTFATPGDLSVVYSTRLANYIQIGKLITVSVSIITTTFTWTTASGNLRITGLPFTSAAYDAIGAIAFQGLTDSITGTLCSNIPASVTYIRPVRTLTTGNILTLGTSNMSTGTNVQMFLTINYIAA